MKLFFKINCLYMHTLTHVEFLFCNPQRGFWFFFWFTRVSEEVWCVLGFGWLQSHCGHLHRNQMVAKMFPFHTHKKRIIEVFWRTLILKWIKSANQRWTKGKWHPKSQRAHHSLPHPTEQLCRKYFLLGPTTLWWKVWGIYYSGKGREEGKRKS